jgi:hypothetical protein
VRGEDGEGGGGGGELEGPDEAEEPAIDGGLFEAVGDEAREETGLVLRGGWGGVGWRPILTVLEENQCRCLPLGVNEVVRNCCGPGVSMRMARGVLGWTFGTWG